jgi:hypothetical protein
VIYPDMSDLSAKNLKLNQNLPFLFISSIHLDLCDHVKILRCLKGEGVWLKKFLSWIISLCDLEPSYCQLLKKVKQPSHSEVNQDHVILSFSLALSSSSYTLISLFEGLASKCLREKNSHGYSSQNSFLRNSHRFVGYALYWIFIPWFSSI